MLLPGEETVEHMLRSQEVNMCTPFPSRAGLCCCYSCLTLCDPMDCSVPGFLVIHYLPKFAQTRPLSRWCHPAISSSVIPFSSCLQSFRASGSFPMSQLFSSGSQSIEASASFQWIFRVDFLLGWTGLISLQSKGLSRAFSNTTVWKHQFFSTQPSLWSNSHICTWLLEKL